MKRKTFLLLGAVLIVAIAFAGGRYAYRKWKYYKRQAAVDAVVTEILRTSGFANKQLPPTALADEIREYVHNNSIYSEQGEFRALWPQQVKFSQAFLDGITGKRSDPVPMECSVRSTLMSDMLRLKGHRMRNVVLYSPERDLGNHRIIEIWNPDTQAWEAQDPMYNVYWAKKADKRRAGIAEMVRAPDDYHPCNGKKCGWDIVSKEKQKAEWLRDYLRVATINEKKVKLRISIYGPDFDPDKEYKNEREAKGTGTFCDLYAKNCRQGFIPASEFQELNRTKSVN